MSSPPPPPPPAPCSLPPPTPVQIREANAHLAALHGRVAELERRLAAAEGTVRGQAESLIRKDAEMRQAEARARSGTEREMAALQEKLQSSEEKTQQLLGLIQEKDHLIGQLRHRSRLLSKICRSRPVLDNLLAYMAEGERLSPVLGGRSSPELGPSLEANCLLGLDLDGTNDFSLGAEEEEEEEEEEDHRSDQTLFGTTV